MDQVFILRDALASSAIGTVAAAQAAHEAGSEVAVLVTQEALAALARGSFAWPRALSGPHARMALADRGKELGIPVFARGDGRQLDPKAMLAAAIEGGLTVYACPLWSALLGLEGDLPAGLDALDKDAAAKLLSDAKQVIGSF
jgi:peroxiredoxin family protein